MLRIGRYQWHFLAPAVASPLVVWAPWSPSKGKAANVEDEDAPPGGEEICSLALGRHPGVVDAVPEVPLPPNKGPVLDLSSPLPLVHRLPQDALSHPPT